MSGVEAVVIGASAGGLAAVGEVLPSLPAGLSAAVVVVQHVAAGSGSTLPELLGRRSRMPVRFAEQTEPASPGTVYVAPPGYHLLVEPERVFALSVDPPVHHSRPSIDVLFESAADAFGPALVGVVLTGASTDGAAGLWRIAALGGRAIVQDPATATARMMPTAARHRVLEAEVLPLAEIGPRLAALSRDDGHGSRNGEER